MSIFLILIVLILGVFSTDMQAEPACGSEGCAVEVVTLEEPWEPVFFDGFEGVIVPASAAPQFMLDGGWTPTLEQVTAAEVAIADAEGELDHDRQYVGFTEDGEQKIHINGFCDDFGQDGRQTPIFVMDGGEC